MMERQYIDEYINSTCDLIIKHIKNIMLFQDNIKKPWGYHSRFMERLLYPEDELIFKGYSKQIFENLPLGTVPTRKEHIVPLSYLLNNLWKLIAIQDYTDEELSIILKRNLGIAYITQDEQRALDSKQYNLKTRMPEGWCLRKGDPLQRLKMIGIELVDEFGEPISSLI